MPLTLSNISDQAWDTFVADHPHGHVLQSSAWGQFKALHGWRPLRVVLTDDGAPVAGAQILLRQMRFATVAYIPRGPVARPQDIPALLPHLDAAAKRAGAVFLKVEPHWAGDYADFWRGQGFSPARTIQPPSTWTLDLRQTTDQLLAGMKQKWRYNIRLAQKKGVTIRPATRADLPAWYALMQVTGERDGFGIHSAAYYDDAFRLFCEPPANGAASVQRGVLLVAEYEGEMLGGVMIFAFGREAIYMYGASGNSHRNLMPNHALQWAAITWAKACGCEVYDFWGIPEQTDDPPSPPPAGGERTSDDGRPSAKPPVGTTDGETTDDDASGSDRSSDVRRPSSALWGVYRFKQGFGGQAVRYAGAFDRVYNPPLYWAGVSLLPRLKSLAGR